MLAKYVLLVARPARAAARRGRWRKALRSAAEAARAAEDSRKAREQWAATQEAATTPQIVATLQNHSGSATSVNTNVNVTVVMVRPVLDAGLGPVILLPTVKPAKGPATAALGNGRRIKLQLGINLVAALQRDEKIGRSWRGSREGG